MSRTLITENDPLGAFEQPPPETQVTPPENQPYESPPTDDPVLFRSSIHRSATFEGSPPLQGKIHRSETLPVVTSSLANIGSSIKMNFRYFSDLS